MLPSMRIFHQRDAFGPPNGINVDGLGNPGLTGVVVSGFTVSNANFQGILVTNASDVTLTNNHVTGNDRNLLPFAIQRMFERGIDSTPARRSLIRFFRTFAFLIRNLYHR